MSSTNIPPLSVIKKTQDTLGKHVLKPPLSDKLLSKPPFRFLHDVLTCVIVKKSVFRGLFSDFEMKSENIKDKDSKIRYLEKIINCVKFATKGLFEVGVRASKIVSGAEPIKTNEFLQIIAHIIDKRIDTKGAVKRVLSGEKPGLKDVQAENGTSTPKTKSVKENVEEGEEVSKRTSKETSKKHRQRSKSKDPKGKDKEKAAYIEKSSRNERSNINEENMALIKNQQNLQVKKEVQENIETTVKTGAELSSQKQVTQKSNGFHKQNSFSQETPDETGQIGLEKQENQISGVSENSSIVGSRSRTGKAIRPPSARPAAPKVKDKSDYSVQLQEQNRPNTAVGQTPVNVILVGDGDDVSDEEFLIQEKPKEVSSEFESNLPAVTAQTDVKVFDNSGQEHGGLVQKIIATQKEHISKNKPDKDFQPNLNSAKRMETTEREVSNLRTSIQQVTRSANPLAKLMDFLQEDFDAMQRELIMWKKETNELRIKLQQEEAITLKFIEPVKDQLAQVDLKLTDQRDRISDVKASILKNDEKISEMIFNMSCRSG